MEYISKNWWDRSLCIVQYNLQVKDTPAMDAKTIASDLKNLGADGVVLNVGGIYAWYPSRIKYHHINEYLPKDFDLLAELIKECHEQGILVIARFDFSKTDDYVYLNKPWWFVEDKDKNPLIYGRDRMGEWSLLVSTCINGGYRNDELAVPVIKEVLENYKIDGIFFNAPQVEECHCSTCKAKYRKRYNQELPLSRDDFEPDWPTVCLKENIGKLYKTVKELRPDVGVILYYAGYEGKGKYRENLEDRYATADMICTEAQDILSRGIKNLPISIKPGINMKIGNMLEGKPKPFGIIHSSPGMDWRHTGISEAEYLFWMSQIPANNGHIWHSLTGFNATIDDKRIIKNVEKINFKIQNSKAYMEGANSLSQILLIWNGSDSAAGWAQALTSIQSPFDLMDVLHLDESTLNRYQVVIVPDQLIFTEDLKKLLMNYTAKSGSIIVENTVESNMKYLTDLVGVKEESSLSKKLFASYMRFANTDLGLQKGLEDTCLLPLKDKVLYVNPEPKLLVALNLVPPFAPLDGVGAPPERASLCVETTDIPLCLVKEHAVGKVIFLPFEFGSLVKEYSFRDYYQFARNLTDLLLGDSKILSMEMIQGIQVTLYGNGNQIIVHLVNGIGERPLVNEIPYYNLELKIKVPDGLQIKSVTSILEKEAVSFRTESEKVVINLRRLGYWDMLVLQ